MAVMNERETADEVVRLLEFTREIKQITHHTAFGSFVRSPAWRPGTEQMAYEYSEAKGNIELLPLTR